MLAKVNVVTQEEFDDYMKKGPQLPERDDDGAVGREALRPEQLQHLPLARRLEVAGPDVPAPFRPERNDGDARRHDAQRSTTPT